MGKNIILQFYLEINYNIHPSIFFCLSWAKLWQQQPKQRCPDLSRQRLLIFQGNTRAFPDQLRDIVPPTGPGSSLGPPPSGACPEHLSWEGSLMHPKRCQSHLSWLLSMWRSSDYTPSSSQVAETLTLTLFCQSRSTRTATQCCKGVSAKTAS